MLRKMLIGGVMAAVALLGSASAGHAQVSVDLGLHFGSPAPDFMPVPSSPVSYAPAVGANLFSYDGEFYVFLGGAWYAGPRHDGPWVAVRPEFVPRPILAVPVRYYHAPPREWAHYRREGPPRWAPTYGNRWEERHERHGAYRDDRRSDHRTAYRDDRRGERPPSYRDDHRDDHRGDRVPAYRDDHRADRR